MFDNLKENFSDKDLDDRFTSLNSGNKKIRNEIAEHNLKLLKSIVNRISKNFNLDYYEKEDIFQVGSIALLKSIDTFDINKGYRFSTYAETCIKNEILLYLRYNRSSDNLISLQETINKSENLNYECCIEDENQAFVDDLIYEIDFIKIKDVLNNLINGLTDEEKKLINLYYNLGYTNQQIGDIFGMTRQGISQKLIKIRKKLLKKLNEAGYTKEKVKIYLK